MCGFKYFKVITTNKIKQNNKNRLEVTAVLVSSLTNWLLIVQLTKLLSVF